MFNNYLVCAKLYEHDQYNGWVEAVKETSNGHVLHRNRNDKVSSVKVTPGCTLKAYRHINLESLLFTATSDMNYVGHQNNDHMTSFSCTCGKFRFFGYKICNKFGISKILDMKINYLKYELLPFR